jgi:hypothetical protein
LGANSANRDEPPTLHILVSSSNRLNQGPTALETMFHEATHFLSILPHHWRRHCARQLRTPASRASGYRPPGALRDHRRGSAPRLRGARCHVPPSLVALKLFSDEFRDGASRTIPAYLDGRRTLDQTAADLVAALPSRR